MKRLLLFFLLLGTVALGGYTPGYYEPGQLLVGGVVHPLVTGITLQCTDPACTALTLETTGVGHTANIFEVYNGTADIMAIGPLGEVLAADGTNTRPGLGFLSDTNKGWFTDGTADEFTGTVGNEECIYFQEIAAGDIQVRIVGGSSQDPAVDLFQIKEGSNTILAFSSGDTFNDALGQVEASDGTVALPAYSFITDTDNGLYLNAVNDVRLSQNGADVFNYMDIDFNLNIGAGAGDALVATSGLYNTNVGYLAGSTVADGDDNTNVGYKAGDAYTLSTSYNTAVGSNALGSTCGSHNTGVGRRAGLAFTGTGGTMIGAQAGQNAGASLYSTYLGFDTDGAFNECIALGATATCTAVNHMVIGGDNYEINSFYIGEGEQTATDPTAGSAETLISGTNIKATEAAVADNTTDDLVISAGISTGSADSGDIVFRVSPGGAATQVRNTVADAMKVLGDGDIDFGGGYGSTGCTIEPDGDLLCNGKLTVDGGVDPSYISFTPQGSDPMPAGYYGMYIDNSTKELRYVENSGTGTEYKVARTESATGDSLEPIHIKTGVDEILFSITATAGASNNLMEIADSSGDVWFYVPGDPNEFIFDNPGASKDSPPIRLLGDVGSVEQEVMFQLKAAADPYFAILVDDDNTSPVLTTALKLYDNAATFTGSVTGTSLIAGADVTVDSTGVVMEDQGSSINSLLLTMEADNTGTTQTGTMGVMFGANPYIRMSAPNAAGTATPTMDMRSDLVSWFNGEAGVDYYFNFNGETNDGTFTYMEDEDRFDFDNDVDVVGDLTAATIASDGVVSGTGITGTSFVIGGNTLDTNEWAFLDSSNQAVATGSAVTFDDITVTTPSNVYALSHDSFADFSANEHIDWTAATGNFSTSGTHTLSGNGGIVIGDGADSLKTLITANDDDTDASVDWNSTDEQFEFDAGVYVTGSVSSTTVGTMGGDDVVTEAFGCMHYDGGVENTNNTDGTGALTQDTMTAIVNSLVVFTSGEVSGVTADVATANKLTVDSGSAGPYVLTYQVSFSGGANDTYKCAIYKNGSTRITETTIKRKLGAGGDVGSASGVGVESLVATDYIQLYCENDTNTDEIVFHQVSVCMNRIGQ